MLDEVEFELEINTKKMKVITDTREPQQLSIQCRGEWLDQVKRLKYLGSTSRRHPRAHGLAKGDQGHLLVTQHFVEKSCCSNQYKDAGLVGGSGWMWDMDSQSCGFKERLMTFEMDKCRESVGPTTARANDRMYGSCSREEPTWRTDAQGVESDAIIDCLTNQWTAALLWPIF